MIAQKETSKQTQSTVNACKLCAPLGACLAFKGIRGAVPFIHGSQGCATYIRRYMISHFKEPIDIASSSFSEETAIFGGESNMLKGIENVKQQYSPELIGIATSCLSETIGDCIENIVKKYDDTTPPEQQVKLVPVATPSYKGTHVDGFNAAVKALVKRFAVTKTENILNLVNILPGICCPADLRTLKNIVCSYGVKTVMLPDYSETLDGGLWREYHRIPDGGTGIEEIASMPSAKGSIEFGFDSSKSGSASEYLEKNFAVLSHFTLPPVGIELTDKFIKIIIAITGTKMPIEYLKERERLADSYIDAHKYVAAKRAAVCGDPEITAAITSFLFETGIIPVICSSGTMSRSFKENMLNSIPALADSETLIMTDNDYDTFFEKCRELKPDIIIGSSKNFRIAKELNIPLVRVSFPVHDRFGASRLNIFCYNGTQRLYDEIVNALITVKQYSSDVGYSYI